jgi:hypothetical protein
MESGSSPRAETSVAAVPHAAPDAVTEAGTRVGGRVPIPWWYHVGFGVAIAFALISISLRFASFGVPAMSLGVLALSLVLKNSTGIADPYTATPHARRLTRIWALISVAVAATGMYLEWGADVRLAIAVAGVLIGALKIIFAYRIDQAVQRDLRAKHDRAGL